ncbi:BspA family leucine-rich repeat surface protein [Candidatus Saccharibacteria bacterium]|nr:BspA family leucine-rich repeat surface protein [Candidatus Saccharibacteria bacterium]
MKRLKNKKTLLFGGILFLAVAALGVTIAYNHDSSTLANEFRLGAYEVTTSEVFVSPNNWQPGDETEKTLTVSNNSDEDIMVRVKYKGVWRNAADTRNLPPEKDGVELAQIVLQNQSDWELKGDGYYYYKNALAPNSATSSLFQKVVLNPDANFGVDNVCTSTSTGTVCEKPANIYEGAKYHLKITAESVQADAADEAWRFALLGVGENINLALKTLAGNSMTHSWDEDTNIRSIAVVDALPASVNPATAAKTNIAVSGTDPVYAYDDGSHNIYIHTDGRTLYANEDSSRMFSWMGSLASLAFSSSFSTSLVTDMSLMFACSGNLSSQDFLTSFDTSSVTNMNGMFAAMYDITSITIPESFNTSNVTDMGGMFSENSYLTSLILPSSFDTSSVTDMSGMFWADQSLTSLILPESFDTSSVTNMSFMFAEMYHLDSLILPESFDTSSVTDMSWMFALMGPDSFTLPEKFVTSSVTDMSSMFEMSSLAFDFSRLDTSSVTDMSDMFYYSYYTSLTLPSNFVTSSVTKMSGMFEGMERLTSLTLSANFVVNAGTTTSRIFDDISSTATLNSSADASVKALWPYQLRN